MACYFPSILLRSRKLKFTEILFNLFSLELRAEPQARRGLAGWFEEI